MCWNLSFCPIDILKNYKFSYRKPKSLTSDSHSLGEDFTKTYLYVSVVIVAIWRVPNVMSLAMFYFLVFINLPKLICTVYQIKLKQGIPFNCFTCLLVPLEGPYFTDQQGKPALLFTSTCH